MASDRPKDSDNPQKSSAGNAVDRASSVTPLDDDANIDPSSIREVVRQKQQSDHAKPENPQAGPGPVKASPNAGRDRDQRETEPTPKAIEDEIQNSPKQRAKEESKSENAESAIKKAGE